MIVLTVSTVTGSLSAAKCVRLLNSATLATARQAQDRLLAGLEIQRLVDPLVCGHREGAVVRHQLLHLADSCENMSPSEANALNSKVKVRVWCFHCLIFSARSAAACVWPVATASWT